MRLLAALTIAALAAGCAGAGDPGAPSAAYGDYELRGTVTAVDRPRRVVEIDHEAIPGIMPAMIMPYVVADAVPLEGIDRGIRVRGTLRVDARGFTVVALQPI